MSYLRHSKNIPTGASGPFNWSIKLNSHIHFWRTEFNCYTPTSIASIPPYRSAIKFYLFTGDKIKVPDNVPYSPHN